MQDVPAATTSTAADYTDLLGQASWSADSTDAELFAGFMEHESALLNQEQANQANQTAQNTTSTAATTASQASTTAQSTTSQTAQQRETARREAERARRDAEEAAANAAEDDDMDSVFADEDTLHDMKDVPVDSETFAAMKPQLEKYGLSKEDVEALERKVNSEAGMTWGELVSFISGKMASENDVTELTAGQRQKLMTFFQKLGFTEPESQRLVGDMAQGNADTVLAAVNRQLKELPQDKLSSLDQDELKAFMKQLQEIRGQSKSDDVGMLRMVGKAMENAMDKARRLAQIDAQTQKGVDSAAKTLSEAAQAKMETSVSRVQEFSTNTTAAEQARQAERDNARLLQNLSTEEQLKAAADKTAADTAKGIKLHDEKQADLFAKGDSSSEDDAWNDFLQKLRTDKHSATTTTETKSDAAKVMTEAMAQARTDSSAQTKPWNRATAPQAMRQVQDAVLKNLTGGGKRLTIQLNPEHLGQLSVALTVKNSEVSATIRADNHETAQMLAGQLESLQKSLEEQGLKVQRLEVQTQLPGSDDPGWQGLAQQGRSFEQDVMAGMRNGKGGRFGGSGSAATAAETMDMARQAILSGNGSGLHVIA
jgi:flagellar hook-length control protein FliK